MCFWPVLGPFWALFWPKFFKFNFFLLFLIFLIWSLVLPGTLCPRLFLLLLVPGWKPMGHINQSRSSVSFVRSFIHPFICPAHFISKTALRIFPKLCMKVEINKWKFSTETDFLKKVLISLIRGLKD